jgi:hypothetical protein
LPFLSLLPPSLTHITIGSDHCWISGPSSPVILESPRRLESGRVLVQLEWRNLQQLLSNGHVSCSQTHIYGSARPRFLLLLGFCRSSACLIFQVGRGFSRSVWWAKGICGTPRLRTRRLYEYTCLQGTN